MANGMGKGSFGRGGEVVGNKWRGSERRSGM
jgi:hypothetical protein